VARGVRSLAAALILLLLAAAVAGGAKRTVPPGFYGVGYGGNVELLSSPAQGQLWDRLAAGGVESVRVLFNWDIAQKTPHGVPDWSRNDSLVINAVRRGMSVLPVVEYAPYWAKQYPGQVASPPKSTSDYTAFLRLAIRRYGPTGAFWRLYPGLPRRPIRKWQIWNEPEIAFHWYRKPFTRPWAASDARQYVALLRASYTTVHATDPGAKVVAAALSIDSWMNLAKLYKWSPNFKGAFDIAAIQAYSGTPSYIPTLMRNFRSVLDKHGAKKVPMFATEMTWPAAQGIAHPHYTTGYMSGFLTDRAGAAARLTEGYRILRNMRTELKLGRVYWYTGVTAYTSSNEFEYSGLLTFQNGSPRAMPTYSAYQSSAKAAEGCAKKTNGACR
jgi:Glycosyl hydrolase family 53